MKILEQFLKPTQRQLFKMLCRMFEGKTLISDKHFILVKGEVPIMLLAHLDTVHEEPVRDICKSKDKRILMSPQGIGGDDRCGVYAIVNAYELSAKKPWLLFTCDEEIGGIGARFFCTVHQEGGLPKELDDLKCLIEIDRKGSNDAVYYDCDNSDFENYITSKGFKTAYGSFSDISVVAPELKVAAVNLSSGYYNAHTLSEYINKKELDIVLHRVIGIVADVAKRDFPKYEYIEKVYQYSKSFYNTYCFGKSGKAYLKRLNDREKEISVVFDDDADNIVDEPIPKNLPVEYEDMYYELVDYYGYKIEELELLREKYGNKCIYDMYIEETKPFYKKTEKSTIITAVADK